MTAPELAPKPLVERLREMHKDVKICADDARYGLAPEVMPRLAAHKS